jgi:hypothetical protein
MYGVLKANLNTGADSELQTIFTAPLSVVSNQPSYVQDTMSLRRVASPQNVQRWEIEANIAITLGDANHLVHTVKAGHAGVIYIRMPQVAALKKLANTLTLATSAAYLANTSVIAVTGLGNNQMIPGSFITFAGDTKVYMVTDAGSFGINVGIWPPLRKALIIGAAITHGDSVTMQARYDTNTVVGIRYVDGMLADPGSVKFIEAL